jgi:hypothetical protein
MITRPTVVSFFAGPPVYAEYAKSLRASCRQYAMPYVIIPLRTTLETWVEITNVKGRFLWHMMRRLARPLLWVDVDAEFCAEPKLLFNCEADFGVFAKKRQWEWKPIGRTRMKLPEDWPADLGPKWFLSGTVYINNTKGGMELLEAWAVAARKDMRAYEQYQLQEAWCQTRPNTIWLPESYCQIRRRKPDTVICHDLASCKMKGVVRA